MREIKFRAWDSKEKVMYEGSLPNLAMTLDGRISLLESTSETLEWQGTDYSKHIIPLQYTGLKDKNGSEIYEGDIIKYTSNFRENSEVQKLVVSWSDIDGAFHIGWIRTDYAIRNGEIIGNIYENAELLESEGK